MSASPKSTTTPVFPVGAHVMVPRNTGPFNAPVSGTPIHGVVEVGDDGTGVVWVGQMGRLDGWYRIADLVPAVWDGNIQWVPAPEPDPAPAPATIIAELTPADNAAGRYGAAAAASGPGGLDRAMMAACESLARQLGGSPCGQATAASIGRAGRVVA